MRQRCLTLLDLVICLSDYLVGKSLNGTLISPETVTDTLLLPELEGTGQHNYLIDTCMIFSQIIANAVMMYRKKEVH